MHCVEYDQVMRSSLTRMCGCTPRLCWKRVVALRLHTLEGNQLLYWQTLRHLSKHWVVVIVVGIGMGMCIGIGIGMGSAYTPPTSQTAEVMVTWLGVDQFLPAVLEVLRSEYSRLGQRSRPGGPSSQGRYACASGAA